MYVKKNNNKQSIRLNKMIGQFIRESRSAKSLTGTELGELIHVSQQQISRYENGVTSLSVETLDTILSVLETNWSEFYRKVLLVHMDDFMVNTENKLTYF